LSATKTTPDEKQSKIIAEIVELQREYYLENKNKDTERQRKMREIIDRATPIKGD
jgi:hypothetical protein